MRRSAARVVAAVRINLSPSTSRLAALLGALALNACALSPIAGPDYRPPDIAVPSAWTRSAAPAQDSAHPPVDLATWWQQLNDPLLDQLVTQALATAPDLRDARARLRQSRASRTLAEAGLWPGIGLSAGRTRSQSGAMTQTLYNAGFDANWEIDVFGGVRRGIEAATADTQAVEATLNDTQVSLIAEVVLAYIDLRSNQNRIAIARDNLASQDETLEIAGWRAQAGLVSQLDVEQARSTREQTRAAIPALESGQAAAEHRLAVLAGQMPGALHPRLTEVRPLPAAPAQLASAIPAETLRQRPDVRAAERTLAAETARIGVQAAARYPDLTLTGTFGWQAFSLGSLGTAASVTRSMAGTLAATLFDGGRIGSRIVAQEAVREQALVAYEKTVLTALEDVENALAAYAAGRERATARRAAVEAARRAAQLARQLYRSGLTDFQKVLDTERTRLSTEDALATAQADILTAVVQLYKALGGGWKNLESNAS